MAIAVEAAASGREIIWGAPTFDQVYTGWEETRRAAPSYATFVKSRMEANFPGGGRIIYRSLDDPDNARSKTAHGIVIDEAADVVVEAWTEVLRPMLMDTGGWLWAIGTPKGRNWFWREFIMASERPDSMAWNAPTLGCEIDNGKLVRKPHALENPYIAFGEVEQMFRSLPERTFRQEILAEFIEEAGGVFRGVLAAVDRGRYQNEEPSRFHHYAMGCDLARVADFTVLSGMDPSGQQVYFERFNQISWERQVAAIRDATTAYPGTLYLDSTGLGDPIHERLDSIGVNVSPYQFTNASKSALIDNLAMGIERGGVRLMDIPDQTNELLAYQYELTPSRNVRMNAPAGMHDDTVIALALAYWGVARPLPYGSWGPDPLA
jgi:hypothetical protein